MKHRRSGFTLIELLVVISMMTVVFGVSLGTIGLFMRMEGKTVEHLSHSTTWFRQSRDFRTDVHAALNAELTNDESENRVLKLTLPGERRVSYKIVENAIERRESRNDETLRTERYRFPEGKIEFEYDESLGLIHIDFQREETKPGSNALSDPEVRWVVSALVGMDHNRKPPSSP